MRNFMEECPLIFCAIMKFRQIRTEYWKAGELLRETRERMN
jgi:hypothetical protein